MAETKVREARLRRAARRRGLVLKKSKRRDPKAFDYGRFVLVEPRTDEQDREVFSGRIDDVERWLVLTSPSNL